LGWSPYFYTVMTIEYSWSLILYVSITMHHTKQLLCWLHGLIGHDLSVELSKHACFARWLCGELKDLSILTGAGQQMGGHSLVSFIFTILFSWLWTLWIQL
jgi:hypothetical protein